MFFQPGPPRYLPPLHYRVWLGGKYLGKAVGQCQHFKGRRLPLSPKEFDRRICLSRLDGTTKRRCKRYKPLWGPCVESFINRYHQTHTLSLLRLSWRYQHNWVRNEMINDVSNLISSTVNSKLSIYRLSTYLISSIINILCYLLTDKLHTEYIAQDSIFTDLHHKSGSGRASDIQAERCRSHKIKSWKRSQTEMG